jgi:hypothetical protein
MDSGSRLNRYLATKFADFALIMLMIRLLGAITVSSMVLSMNLLHLILWLRMDWLNMLSA